MNSRVFKFPVILAVSTLLAACDNDNNNSDAVATATCAGTGTEHASQNGYFCNNLARTACIIKWRGNQASGAEADSVCFGTDRTALPLNSETDATVTATGHSEALLSGLEPDTTYYYCGRSRRC